jgi:AcrR family transcriptional regulator
MAGKAAPAVRAQNRVSPRSDPQQERSRLRRQALLDAAESIIGESGADGLKMREVARRANLPIASVYHYFPSAPALIRTLVDEMLRALRAILAAGVGRAAEAEDPAAVLVGIVDAAADFMESRPRLPALWGAMRGAPELRTLDVADTEANGRFLAPAVSALFPKATMDEVEALALVVIEGVSAVLQLGCDLPPEKRARLRAMLKQFVAAAVARLMEEYQ